LKPAENEFIEFYYAWFLLSGWHFFDNLIGFGILISGKPGGLKRKSLREGGFGFCKFGLIFPYLADERFKGFNDDRLIAAFHFIGTAAGA
jgi:hypothetical protein